MKISVIGTGYVGLVSGTCFADIGHGVTCIDIDQNKINKLKKGISPIYEPGLSEMLEKNIEAERLHFSTNYDSVKTADVVFLAVGTPSTNSGEANLDYLKSAGKSVANNMSEGTVVVIKSTVPVGTHKIISDLIKENTDTPFSLVNNPEFLKEGQAIEDFMKPDRVIIGHDNEKAAGMMEDLYGPLLRQGNPLYKMSNSSAELSKYAANCFLATKISFINEMARLCDLTGADIEEVRKGISSDRRIGGHFLYPGPGYGGSCFPKDVKALIHTARQKDLDLEIVLATEKVNDVQKIKMFDKIRPYFKGDLKGKTFGLWGVAFKANTDDVRESASLYLSKMLVEAGANIHFFDPEGSENYLSVLEEMGVNTESVKHFKNMYDCLEGTNGLITMTEWREFRNPDFGLIKEKLDTPVIFDNRNLFPTEKVLEAGFDYFAVGKRIVQ